jgi:hypothetical protein
MLPHQVTVHGTECQVHLQFCEEANDGGENSPNHVSCSKDTSVHHAVNSKEHFERGLFSM